MARGDYNTEIHLEINRSENFGDNRVKVWLDDADFEVNYAWSSMTKNISNKWDITFDDVCQGTDAEDISNLTTSLIKTCNNLTSRWDNNDYQDHLDCVEGWGICKTSLEYKDINLGECTNQSNKYKDDVSAAQSNSSKWREKYDNCQSSANSDAQLISDLKQEKEDLEKKPMMWAVIAGAIGVVATTAFHKSKYPRSSEEDQFGEG